jgi:hypothetical protein
MGNLLYVRGTQPELKSNPDANRADEEKVLDDVDAGFQDWGQ